MSNKSMEVKHTPTPWTQVKLHPATILGKGQIGNESFSIQGDSFSRICNSKEVERLMEANAAHIVKAVNEYEALCAVVEAAQLIEGCSEIRPNETPGCYKRRILEPMIDALVALSTLRKEQGV